MSEAWFWENGGIFWVIGIAVMLVNIYLKMKWCNSANPPYLICQTPVLGFYLQEVVGIVIKIWR